jgi:hypothetical protein
MRRPLLLLLAMLLLTAPALAADYRGSVRADLVAAIAAYRAALDRVAEFNAAAVIRAAGEVEKRRELLARGLIARRDLEESERALENAEAKLAGTRREMVVADHSLTEALIEDPPPPSRPTPPGRPAPPDRLGPERYETTPLFVRYRGRAHWSLAEAPKVQGFFARQFGRPLPVSAFGQTPLHDRLGFDHREAIDVALMPDSPEGAALMSFLRGSGISFMAYRGPVRGEATGAHIHIGDASRRL